jgi:hypothetical protein
MSEIEDDAYTGQAKCCKISKDMSETEKTEYV